MSTRNKSANSIIKRAKDIHATTEVQIDTPATKKGAEEMLSRSDEGTWVKAWVWVPK